MVHWTVKFNQQKDKMNLNHPLFNPANWTKDQRESAGIIAALLVLGTACLIGAFVLPLAFWLVSMLLLLIGLLILATAWAGISVEFWEKRNE